MRAFQIVIISLVVVVPINCQFWKHHEPGFNNSSWLRRGKTSVERSTIELNNSVTVFDKTSTTVSSVIGTIALLGATLGATNNDTISKISKPQAAQFVTLDESSTKSTINATHLSIKNILKPDSIFTTTEQFSSISADRITSQTPRSTSSVVNGVENSALSEEITQETFGTTEEPRDNHRAQDFYLSKREKPQVKISSNISQNLLPLPAGAGAALVKPTKYHQYPHNQHIYVLPECAIQQVCNAVYVRLNWTQPLCACPSRYRDPCSASLNADDQHTTELATDHTYKALTLVKTCEPTTDMKACGNTREWSLLALQNIRTGKSHYLVICRCTEANILEGPMSHDQPTYASVPGIRVYGMMCVQGGEKRIAWSPFRTSRSSFDVTLPWDKVKELVRTATWD